MAKNEKIVKYRKPFYINIGVIIFAIIIIYVLFNVFVYLTTDQVAEYEVQQGTIVTNNVYRGLILRDEEVVYAEQDGAINYYVKNGSRVSVNDTIYSVDMGGNISNEITAASDSGASLTTEDLHMISNKIDGFMSTYDSNCYYETYSFKNDIDSQLSQTLNTNALNQLAEKVDSAIANGTFIKKSSSVPGTVLYYLDGYEDKTIDGFSEDYMNTANLEKINLNTNTSVTTGSPVYKIIKSDNWNMIIPISSSLAEKLADDSYIRVRFCKDDRQANASYTLMKDKEQYYLNLSFRNDMIRYAYERFMNIELMLEEESGLKIPNSSITTKDFYMIPKEFFFEGANSSDPTILIEQPDAKDDGTVIQATPTIYYETDDHYYIDDECVKTGDIIKKSNSSETYTIGRDVAPLNGVYNINKGYAVFKQIDVTYQNEEYTIVKPGISYGIALYDHIALDGSKIKEDQLVIK